MRTLIMVAVMVLVALAAGLSFVIKAGAQVAAGTAKLEYRCGDGDGSLPSIPTDVPTLRSCTATVTNTGSSPLLAANIVFEPSSPGLPAPDSYCFFSAARDGVDQPVRCGTLSYDFGDIAAGAQSTITLRIIVRSTREYGADVVLRTAPDAREYARVQVHGLVSPGAAAPAPPLKLYRTDVGDPSTGPVLPAEPSPAVYRVAYRLMVVNSGGEPYDDVKIEMAATAFEYSGVSISESETWVRSGASGHLLRDLGPLPARSDIARDIVFAVERSSGICALADPVIVVTARRGATVDTAAVTGGSTLLGACGGGEGGGANSAALPVTGAGTGAGDGRADPTRNATRALALSVLLLLAGVSLRRAGQVRR